MPLPCVRRTTLVQVGSSSCSGIIINTSQGYVLTHASVLLPLLTTKTLLIQRLQKTGRLHHSHLSDGFPSVMVFLLNIFIHAVTDIPTY